LDHSDPVCDTDAARRVADLTRTPTSHTGGGLAGRSLVEPPVGSAIRRLVPGRRDWRSSAEFETVHGRAVDAFPNCYAGATFLGAADTGPQCGAFHLSGQCNQCRAACLASYARH